MRKLHATAPVSSMSLSSPFRALLAAALAGAAATATATPVTAEEMAKGASAVAEPAHTILAVDAAYDVDQWIHGEAARHLLSHSFDDGRGLLVHPEWEARQPSWIQGSALASEASQVQSERASERAEQELQTLQWVLEEQRRQAEAAHRPRRSDESAASGSDDRWFRRLLPQQWIAHLKAHREWVAAGGTTLLLAVWGASVFARRPTSATDLRKPTPVEPAPRQQHRRRRRHRVPQFQ